MTKKFLIFIHSTLLRITPHSTLLRITLSFIERVNLVIFKRLRIKNCALKIARRSEQGVVALITSIVVGLLLVVITSSIVGIMRSELRQATDFDLSTKAYFAAESGVEDAIAFILSELAAGRPIPVNEVCDDEATKPEANLSNDPPRTIAYTCQTIRVEDTALVGELDKEENIQLNLAAESQYNFVKISWNQRGTNDPQDYDPSAIPALFPTGDEWKDSADRLLPAVIESTFIIYPKTAGFSSDDIRSTTAVLKPAISGSTGNPPAQALPVEVPENVDCETGGVGSSYDCVILINVEPFANVTNNNFVLRLHARYSATHYKIELFNGDCGEACRVEVPGSQIIVDVTGKAGDVFRRIQARSFLGGQSPLPFAILTDEDICKVLTVVGGSAIPESGCAP